MINGKTIDFISGRSPAHMNVTSKDYFDNLNKHVKSSQNTKLRSTFYNTASAWRGYTTLTHHSKNPSL